MGECVAHRLMFREYIDVVCVLRLLYADEIFGLVRIYSENHRMMSVRVALEKERENSFTRNYDGRPSTVDLLLALS